MTKKIHIFVLFSFACILANGQNVEGWGISQEEQRQREEYWREIEDQRNNEYNEYIQKLQKETDEQIKSIHSFINNIKFQEDYVQQQQHSSSHSSAGTAGIQIVNDGYDKSLQERRQAAARQKAKEQAEKAQHEADHQQWLAQKQAADAAAAERRRLRLERERIEQQRRYNEALANEYRSNANHYNRLHNDVDYKATEGYERMVNTQPEGTEQMQSGYMPSSIHIKKADIQSVVSKHSSGKTVSLTLNGNEYIKPSEWSSPDFNPTPKLPPTRPYFDLSEDDTSDIVGYEIKPIADGCGAAGDKLSHDLALLGSQIEAAHIKEINGIRYYSIIPLPYTDEDVKAMEKYCYPHDLEYFYGRTFADKRKADKKLAKGAPVKGMAVMMSTQSIVAFINARKANEMSRYLQHKYNVDVEYGMYLAPVKSKKK